MPAAGGGARRGRPCLRTVCASDGEWASSAHVPPAVTSVPVVDLSDSAEEAHNGWTAFYRREYPRLARAMFAYTGDREVACEVAQEAMARSWSHWARVARFANPAAWTCRVAMNLANSKWRRRLLARHVAAEGSTNEAAVDIDVGMRLAVRQAVAELPRRQRTAVVLRYFVDLSVEDVARLMRCRPGTVTALTAQAIGRLRACAALTEHDPGREPR